MFEAPLDAAIASGRQAGRGPFTNHPRAPHHSAKLPSICISIWRTEVVLSTASVMRRRRVSSMWYDFDTALMRSVTDHCCLPVVQVLLSSNATPWIRSVALISLWFIVAMRLSLGLRGLTSHSALVEAVCPAGYSTSGLSLMATIFSPSRSVNKRVPWISLIGFSDTFLRA